MPPYGGHFASVWYVRTSDAGAPGGASKAAVGTGLSRDEISRWRSFAAVEPANLYLLSRLMLRHVLTHCHPSIAPLGWCFAIEATGRPRIDAVPGTVGLHFSISHCQRAVAIAVASVEGIGVDVESTDVDAGMATALLGQLHTSEVQELPRQQSGALNTRHMLGLWTLKEAYLKAIGTGLSVPPKAIAFDRLNRLMPECRLPPENAGRLWDFFAPEVPDGICLGVAIARPSSAGRPVELAGLPPRRWLPVAEAVADLNLSTAHRQCFDVLTSGPILQKTFCYGA